MHRRIVLAIAAIGLVAGPAAPHAGAATHAAKPQRVTVNMYDYRFVLKPSRTVQADRPVIFTVVNHGKTVHNFDIQGVKATKILKPGKRTTMKVTFHKNGTLPYLCDVPRHAELGMTGKLKVRGADPVKRSAKAAPHRVSVTMLDYRFKLAPKGALKAGVAYTFTVVNKGKTVHNFDIQRVKATPIAGPGSKKTMKVTFKKPGRYTYVCDVPRHAELGMTGTLVVKK